MSAAQLLLPASRGIAGAAAAAAKPVVVVSGYAPSVTVLPDGNVLTVSILPHLPLPFGGELESILHSSFLFDTRS